MKLWFVFMKTWSNKIHSTGCYLPCCSCNPSPRKHWLRQRERIWFIQIERRQITLPPSNSCRVIHVQALIRLLNSYNSSTFIVSKHVSVQVRWEITRRLTLPARHCNPWWQHYKTSRPRCSFFEPRCFGKDCILQIVWLVITIYLNFVNHVIKDEHCVRYLNQNFVSE